MASRRFEGAITAPEDGGIVITTIDAIRLYALIRHRDWFDPPATAESAV